MNSLIGIWFLVGFIYHGSPMPPLNPNLQLYYSFQSQGRNELKYFRKDETGFCRREAQFEVNKQEIHQVIDFVDPENASSCSADPDMQLNQASSVHFEIRNEQLVLFLKLGDDDIQYVFSRITPGNGPHEL